MSKTASEFLEEMIPEADRPRMLRQIRWERFKLAIYQFSYDWNALYRWWIDRSYYEDVAPYYKNLNAPYRTRVHWFLARWCSLYRFINDCCFRRAMRKSVRIQAYARALGWNREILNAMEAKGMFEPGYFDGDENE